MLRGKCKKNTKLGWKRTVLVGRCDVRRCYILWGPLWHQKADFCVRWWELRRRAVKKRNLVRRVPSPPFTLPEVVYWYFLLVGKTSSVVAPSLTFTFSSRLASIEVRLSELTRQSHCGRRRRVYPSVFWPVVSEIGHLLRSRWLPTRPFSFRLPSGFPVRFFLLLSVFLPTALCGHFVSDWVASLIAWCNFESVCWRFNPCLE